MLTKSGAKLLDFGLAKPRGPAAPITMSVMTASPTPATATGTILGTIHYMAPEQVEGTKATKVRGLGIFVKNGSGRWVKTWS